jgi:hypothetical protein
VCKASRTTDTLAASPDEPRERLDDVNWLLRDVQWDEDTTVYVSSVKRGPVTDDRPASRRHPAGSGYLNYNAGNMTSEMDSWPFPAPLPSTASVPCARFLEGISETIEFILFVTQVVTRADEVSKIAREALLATEQSETKKETMKRSPKQAPSVVGQLRRHRQLIFQMLITRSVDHYLAYVSELLSTVFHARPETLRSKEQVEIEFVLRHDTMDNLVLSLAERRVDRLIRHGIKQLAKELHASPGITLFGTKADLLRATQIVENRNLIVHNRAVVNGIYLRNVPASGLSVGDRLDLDFDEVIADAGFLALAGVATDQLATTKWDLPQVSVSTAFSAPSEQR